MFQQRFSKPSQGLCRTGLIAFFVMSLGLGSCTRSAATAVAPTATESEATTAALSTQLAAMATQTAQASGQMTPGPTPIQIAQLNGVYETSPDGSIKYLSELSVPSLGLGSLQLTYPATMTLGSTEIIELKVTPDSALSTLPQISVTPASVTDPSYVLQMSTGIQIYPIMSAEMVGQSFDILPAGVQTRVVTSASIITWLWGIRPNQTGKQALFITLSTPVIIDQARNVMATKPLGSQAITIVVESSPTPTPTPSPTLVPPLVRLGDQLIDNAATIVVAVITLIGTLAGVYVAYLVYRNSQKKKTSSSEQSKKKAKRN